MVVDASAADPTKTMRPSNPATDPLGRALISRCAVPRFGAGPAQVATRSALSIRKSACTPGQCIYYLVAIHAADADPLRSRVFAAHDADVSLEIGRASCRERVVI